MTRGSPSLSDPLFMPSTRASSHRIAYGNAKTRLAQAYTRFPTCGFYHAPIGEQTADINWNRKTQLEVLSGCGRTQSALCPTRQFLLVGYVVMPEHIHLLISEPKIGTPSSVMQALKQRVSRLLRRKPRRRRDPNQLRLWQDAPDAGPRSFWQRRFHDFNVRSRRKWIEKLQYMHMNPVKRGLAADAKLWTWSSYRFYQYGERSVCTPDPEPR
jgi:REP element-mobilizing transposase RayT